MVDVSPVILIVEDEAMISLTLLDALKDHGVRVAGPYRANATALTYLETEKPDGAIIDFNLLDGICEMIAERLTALGVPFFVISGSRKEGHYIPALEVADWLGKPFS